MEMGLQALMMIGSKLLTAAQAVPGVSAVANAVQAIPGVSSMANAGSALTQTLSSAAPQVGSTIAQAAPRVGSTLAQAAPGVADLVVTAPVRGGLGNALSAAGSAAATAAPALSETGAPRSQTQTRDNSLGRELGERALDTLTAPDMSGGGEANIAPASGGLPTGGGVGAGLNISSSTAPDISPWRRRSVL